MARTITKHNAGDFWSDARYIHQAFCLSYVKSFYGNHDTDLHDASKYNLLFGRSNEKALFLHQNERNPAADGGRMVSLAKLAPNLGYALDFMENTLDMGINKIVNIATPEDPGDLATLGYLLKKFAVEVNAYVGNGGTNRTINLVNSNLLIHFIMIAEGTDFTVIAPVFKTKDFANDESRDGLGTRFTTTGIRSIATKGQFNIGNDNQVNDATINNFHYLVVGVEE